MTPTLDISATVLCTSVSSEPSEAQLRLDDSRLSVRGTELAEEANLDEIFDVRLGPPPQAAEQAFGAPVLTVGFERGGQRVVLFVDGSETTLRRVSALLFRRLLDGTEVAACHPATIGGRVPDRQFEIGELRVTPGRVGCTGIRYPLHVELESIVSVGRSERELQGRRDPAIEFRYVRNGVVVGVDLSLNPPRKLNLLGRYLRREYSRTRQPLRGFEPPAPVVRALTRLYAHGGRTDSGAELAAESDAPESLLRSLRQHDLVELDDGEVTLTMRGWTLVFERASAPAATYR
ncbi:MULTISPECIES: CheF family chemotaxis protein [Haloarcula]|uniref:CheF family chemotaxis protein n=1 Tax=Haloarcula TaxID=2237 RepID=UPI0023ECB1EF|nr:CheF family chemotaxis protein [Halomicroarcula sp. XH51]